MYVLLVEAGVEVQLLLVDLQTHQLVVFGSRALDLLVEFLFEGPARVHLGWLITFRILIRMRATSKDLIGQWQ